MKYFECVRAVAAWSTGCVMFFSAFAGDSRACTTFKFSTEGRSFVAKNYDWDKEQGMIYVNKRGVSKQSLKVFANDQILEWTSKFGSLTFNQYGRELPNAGMNEAGLVVEVMELGTSRFETAGAKSSVNESQWVQFMLDNAASVEDVKALSKNIRISKILVPLHYMVCDSDGSCAAFESLNGRLLITDQIQPGTAVLTNHTYAESMTYLRQFSGFGGSRNPPDGDGSLERFARAATFVKNSQLALVSSFDVGDGFEGLSAVQTAITQWSIVYDLGRRQIAFKSRSSRALKSVQLNNFDLGCSSPVMGFPIISRDSGDVSTMFRPYSDQLNRQLVEKSLAGDVPRQLIEAAANLPGSTQCVSSMDAN